MEANAAGTDAPGAPCPERFLPPARGVNVENTMADLFLSYASQDRELARNLAARLGKQGWTVWWDRKIQAGAWFDRAIEREIEQARGVIVLWSIHSVESDWVRAEARSGRERQILIPVLVDEVRIPLEFNGIQAASWPRNHRGSDAQDLAMLFEAVRLILGPERAPPVAIAPVDAPRPRPRRWLWPAVAALVASAAVTLLVVRMKASAGSQASIVSPAPASDQQAAVGAARPPTEAPPPVRRPEPLAGTPGRRLFKGSTGPDVADLRAALRMLGYLERREDPASEQIFGEETRDAVMRFQKKRGLVADGIVGPQLLAEFKNLASRSAP